MHKYSVFFLQGLAPDAILRALFTLSIKMEETGARAWSKAQVRDRESTIQLALVPVC